jgi:hypothetical protein
MVLVRGEVEERPPPILERGDLVADRFGRLWGRSPDLTAQLLEQRPVLLGDSRQILIHRACRHGATSFSGALFGRGGIPWSMHRGERPTEEGDGEPPDTSQNQRAAAEAIVWAGGPSRDRSEPSAAWRRGSMRWCAEPPLLLRRSGRWMFGTVVARFLAVARWLRRFLHGRMSHQCRSAHRSTWERRQRAWTPDVSVRPEERELPLEVPLEAFGRYARSLIVRRLEDGDASVAPWPIRWCS